MTISSEKEDLKKMFIRAKEETRVATSVHNQGL